MLSVPTASLPRNLAWSAISRRTRLQQKSLWTSSSASRSYSSSKPCQSRAYVSPRLTSSTSSAFRSFATTPRRQATQIKPYLLADVGEGITECEIIKWFVQPGAVVQEFDPICEVQSDKASVEITSRYAGKVKQLMHKEGDVAKVGEALCEIEIEAEEGEVGLNAGPSTSPAESEADVQITGVKSDSEFARVDMEGFTSHDKQGLQNKGKDGRDILATPAVRRVSREHNVNLAHVNGTGKDGRITKEDVVKFVENGSVAPASVASTSPAPSSSSTPSAEAQVVALDPVRRAMFRAMTSTLQVPHFAYSDEVDVTALEKIRVLLSQNVPIKYRKTNNKGITAQVEQVEEEGRFDKLTMLPLLVKALSLALHEHPLFRSTLSLPPASAGLGEDVHKISSQAKLHRRASHDISIALSSPAGLLTPCISSVETNTIFDLASNIVRLQNRSASTKGLSPKDLKATGTVTLSNIGAVGGGTYTHPLLPPTGQLAIGALGRTRALPRFASEVPGADKALVAADADRVVRRLIMPVSFTGDHRVVEGAELAKFVNRWKALVESPELWLGVMQ